MTDYTPESRELALTIINDGERYRERCYDARQSEPDKASRFAFHAMVGARKYERDFGDGSRVFSARDILLAAIELCAYYERHNAENDATEQVTP